MTSVTTAPTTAAIPHAALNRGPWTHVDVPVRQSRSAPPGAPGLAASRALLVRPRAGRLAGGDRGAGRVLGTGLAAPAVACAAARGDGGRGGRASDRDAALAVPGTPVGAHRRRRLHQDRVVDAGVARRTVVPGADGGHR